MPNMFNSPLGAKYMNTYTRLPFEEISKMGDKLEKRTDEFNTSMDNNSANIDQDVMDADMQYRDEDQAIYKQRMDQIGSLHKDGDLRGAKALADQLGSELRTYKTQGRGKAMQDSLEGYQRDVKAFDSAEAKGLISADKAAWERKQLRTKYGGVGELTDDGYSKYDGRLPSVMATSLTAQADKLIQGWKADGTYKMMTDDVTGDSYWINKKKEEVTEKEVKNALNAGLRTEGNVAYLERNADFLMKDLDPNANTFEHNGQTYNREELKQKLVDEELSKPLNFGSAKAGYSKETATPIKNWMLEQTLKSAAKARAAAASKTEAFVISGKWGVDVSAKNVDDLRKAVGVEKRSVKSQSKSLIAYEAENPNASNEKTLADGTPNPNYDPSYATLMAEKEKSVLALAEHESWLYVARQKADKLINNNTGDFQFLDSQNPTYNKRDYQVSDVNGNKHNPIYGLVAAGHASIANGNGGVALSPEMEEALSEAAIINDPATGERIGYEVPNKLNKLMQQGIKDGLSLKELLKSHGLNEQLLNQYAPNGGATLGRKYQRAVGQYSDGIDDAMGEDKQRVSGYQMITGIENGKFSSATAKLFSRQAESVANLAGAGYSAPDGRQIDQYLREELGESWQEEYDEYQDVKIYQTTGQTASGKPIIHMAVTDKSGELHQIPMVGSNNDMYLQTAKEMAGSNMRTTKQEGQNMIMNVTPVGNSTVGAIVKGSGMESMWEEDKISGKEVPRKGVKSPLIGFKAGGNQLYIRPKKIAGDGLKTYQIVKDVKQDDGTMKEVIVEETVGGSNDLRNILHSKLVNSAQANGNEYFISQYGAGKGK